MIKKINSKGQIWGLDIMAGSALFLIGIVIFLVYSLNQSPSYDTIDLLSYDGKIITENLLSEGYPNDWSSNNVVTIGLTTSGKINQTKLEELYQMIYVENNYTRTKNLFATNYDYYFYLDIPMTTSGGSIEGMGKPGVTASSINAKDLTKITRYTVYENITTPLYLYIWQE